MKKRTKTKIIVGVALGAIMSIMFTSCEDYFDVKPKARILTDDHFSRESGFKDQLTGVYTAMSSESLYGREMTFGFTEVLAQNYGLEAESNYRYAAQYDYENAVTKNKINNIWKKTYNCIANLNVMLEYYETVDSTIFTQNHYNLYRGEAIGLRAFLHFELMRGFAPSPESNGSALGVPYVTEYEPKVTPRKTVDETMELVIADLKEAIIYLESDSIYGSDTPYIYREERKPYFNYYAAKQILARAYLWIGDMENAAATAEEIVSVYELNNVISWVYYDQMMSVPNEQVNRIYSNEHVFRLDINNMNEIIKRYFTKEGGIDQFTFTEDQVDKIYEISTEGLGNDWRALFGFSYDGEKQYLWKYYQGTYKNMMPIIKKAEIYYIAAEAQKETNPARSIELLNIVRSNRNIAYFELSPELTTSEIQEEIFKEYRKEFLGEGQLFFYYKRLNIPTIEGAPVAANDDVYVWPLPDNEIEFGY